MAYTVVSQNNTVTKLEDDQGNVIHVPAIASLAKSTDYTIKSIKNSTATLEHSNGKTYKDVPCVVVLADDSSNYTKLSQKNTKATLENTDTNVIHVPSKVILASSTDYTLIKVNNSTATLEDGSGNVIRDIPCVSLLTDENNTISTLNNSTASVLDGDGQTVNDVPCVVVLLKASGGATVVIIKGTSPLNLPDAIANSLSYVKAFGGTEQRNLPLGYTQFGRIHFDGNCYFDTGIVINSLTATVKLIATFDSQTSSTPCMMWGYMGSNANLPRWGVGLYSSKWLTSPNGTLPYGTTDTDKHIFITELYDNSGTSYWRTYVDGALLGGAAIVNPETITENTISTYIGARNNNGTAGNYVEGNFTYLEITQDGVCLAKIYPCKRDSDNVLGLYNTVTNEFLPNLGTGTLTADIFASPTPDTPIDIVSNNGALRFQDSELPSEYRRLLGYACDDNALWQITGFHLRGSDTIRISFSVTAGCNVFGCYQGTDATDNYDLYVSTSSGSKYLRYGNGTYLSYWSSADLGQRFDVVFTPTGSSGMPQDSTWTPLTFESANDMLLGATILTGTSAKLRGNLYGSFVVDGRLNLIPCERVSDGSLGYYDTYTGTFYEPVGTPTSLGYDNSYKEITVGGPIETISVHGKNLLDMSSENIVLGKYIDSSGVVTDSPSNFYNSKYIPVVAEETYTWSTSSSINYISFMEYDSSKTFLQRTLFGSSSTSAGTSGSITLRSDTAFVLIGSNMDGSDVTLDKVAAVSWQFEKGSTATDYQPYYDGGTATTEMLLSVGDHTDQQEIIGGTVTRKVGVKVLDGTENWIISGGVGVWANFQSIIGTGFATSSALCSHSDYAGAGISVANMSQNQFSLYTNGNIAFKNAHTTSTTDWANFLADQYTNGTPVIVVYPMATPTTESVAGQPLQVTGGDNIAEITQASLDGLELEVQYSAAVTLTVQEVENANLDNNVEVTIS